MSEDAINNVVVFLGSILSRQSIMGVAQLYMGTYKVCQTMLELRAVGGLGVTSVGGDVVVVEAIFFLNHC